MSSRASEGYSYYYKPHFVVVIIITYPCERSFCQVIYISEYAVAETCFCPWQYAYNSTINRLFIFNFPRTSLFWYNFLGCKARHTALMCFLSLFYFNDKQKSFIWKFKQTNKKLLQNFILKILVGEYR